MADETKIGFESEAEEADWWAANQDLIAERFERAESTGEFGHGTVARIGRERTGQTGSHQR